MKNKGKANSSQHIVKVSSVERKIKGGYIGVNSKVAKQLGIKTNVPFDKMLRG